MEPHGDPRHHTPGPSGAKGSPKRGRPMGSVALAPDVEQAILDAIRAGAMDYVAAEAAGVSARTFYDWMARGEDRHPSRPGTPQLRAFAKAVRTARAQARMDAETRVHQEDPRHWLAHAAPTTSEEQGWSEPPPREGLQGLDRSSEEGLQDWLARVLEDRGAPPEECQQPNGDPPGRSPRPEGRSVDAITAELYG